MRNDLKMLKLKNINKSYCAIKAADNCSLTIKANKITGLIGPNGAGKSTLFNIIGYRAKRLIFLECY